MNRQHGPDEPIKVSAELLNAFVDNQLEDEEKSRLFVEINQDDRLSREVCELRKVRELVAMAYQHVPPPAARAAGGRYRHAGTGMAASIGLAIGVAFGWWLHDAPTPGSPLSPVAKQAVAVSPVQVPAQRVPAAKVAVVGETAERSQPVASAGNTISERVARPELASKSGAPDAAADAATPSPEMLAFADAGNEATPTPTAVMPGRVKSGLASASDATKVLIHVSDNNPRHLAQALEDIDTLMRHYRSSGEQARVEVVINGTGLDLVRADISAFSERIARMQQEYGNLSFAACQNTIDRLRRERGIVTRLLPGVTVIDSGVAQIMRRQHQGWAYIQV